MVYTSCGNESTLVLTGRSDPQLQDVTVTADGRMRMRGTAHGVRISRDNIPDHGAQSNGAKKEARQLVIWHRYKAIPVLLSH